MPDRREETFGASETTTRAGAVTPAPAAGPTGGGTASRSSSPAFPEALSARYDEAQEVGRGGMGIVYAARDRETGERVALKVLRPDIAARADHVERFKAELRLARRITHKNVCRTYELLRFGDVVVIAMEYVSGESLRDVLRRFGGAPLRRGLEWARQICGALAEAHGQGIVHRDLKPENVLIDDDGNAKVMDFGIAHSLEAPQAPTGSIVGTPAYMSPEQAQGLPVDARTDVYALGLILYEMFAGRRAFQADTPLEVIRKQVQDAPRPPRDVEPLLPEFLDRVILRCLEKDPARRFPGVADVERALGRQDAHDARREADALPERMLAPRRSDIVLWLAAAAGLAAFLTLLPRVLPESTFPIQATRGQLIGRAEQELARRGWPVTEPHVRAGTDSDLFRVLVRDRGARPAGLSPFQLSVHDHHPTNDRWEATVGFDVDGRLRSVEVPAAVTAPEGAALDREGALELARRELQGAFGLDVSAMKIEAEGALTEEGRPGWSFNWTAPSGPGLKSTAEARVVGRVTRIRRAVTAAEPPARERSGPTIMLTLMFVWGAIGFAIHALRRLYRNITGRQALSCAALGFAMSLVMLSANADASSALQRRLVLLLITTAVGLLFTAGLLIDLFATLHVLERRGRELAASTLALLDWRPEPRATAIAALRGAGWGLCALGAYAVGHVLAQRFWSFDPHLDTPNALSSPLPAVTAIAGTLISGHIVAGGITFVVGVLRRFTLGPAWAWLAGASTVAVALADQPAVQLIAWTVTGAFVAAALVHQDFLAALAAALTIQLWEGGVVNARILAPVGNWDVIAVLALWTALVAWAAFVAYRELWLRAARRLGRLVD